jgi:type I restriction enzyme S subunit
LTIKRRLDEIAELQVGFAFKSAGFSGGDQDVRLLRGDNIGQGVLRWENAVRWSADDAVDERYAMQAGDLVIAMDRPWIGAGLKFASVTERDLPAWLVQRVARLRAKPGVDQRYLHYLFASRDFTSHILAVQTGTAIPHVSGPQILSFQCPDHSLLEQRAIAEVLGALDDKIAANARLTESIDRLLDARFEGATRGAPQGMLEEIAEVNGITVTPGQGQIRYIDIASVGVGSYEYPALTDWSSAPGRARRKVSEGDTVWSTVRPNRRSHALVLDAGRNIVASTGLAVITPREEDFAFVYESTRTSQFTTFLESIAEGSAYPAVKAPRFAEAPVPLPSVEQRRAFEALAAPLRRRGHAAAMESRSLARTRDELLPLLMSGKVRVKDAEKIVEGSL